jgi:hypothetical protein
MNLEIRKTQLKWQYFYSSSLIYLPQDLEQKPFFTTPPPKKKNTYDKKIFGRTNKYQK